MLNYLLFTLTIGGIYGLLALSLNLIWGGAGMVNLALPASSRWGLCLGDRDGRRRAGAARSHRSGLRRRRRRPRRHLRDPPAAR